MGLAPSVETHCWLAVGGEIMESYEKGYILGYCFEYVLFMPGEREPINNLFLHSDIASYIWVTFSIVVE